MLENVSWLACLGGECEIESILRGKYGQFHILGAVGKKLAEDFHGFTRTRKRFEFCWRSLVGAEFDCLRKTELENLLRSAALISTCQAQEMQKSSRPHSAFSRVRLGFLSGPNSTARNFWAFVRNGSVGRQRSRNVGPFDSISCAPLATATFTMTVQTINR